ncbi:ORF3' [Pebjah virus]|uniref:ORF3 n=1 Tax=Pebjah virus TaxID=1658615 RepID=A0A0G2UIM6_9NIDO|nr:ORF3' [Pebjah virus]AKI29929.1 ORF3' [Pebjah virus]AKI29944.1 ORF3' [Pebjah virus]AKI29959.1 ORF3' [Pebjah virus]
MEHQVPLCLSVCLILCNCFHLLWASDNSSNSSSPSVCFRFPRLKSVNFSIILRAHVCNLNDSGILYYETQTHSVGQSNSEGGAKCADFSSDGRREAARHGFGNVWVVPRTVNTTFNFSDQVGHQGHTHIAALLVYLLSYYPRVFNFTGNVTRGYYLVEDDTYTSICVNGTVTPQERMGLLALGVEQEIEWATYFPELLRPFIFSVLLLAAAEL